ncbi:MAG: hypothetical protein II777_00965, partial [Clostridia bacterium]|nr:hypothetical protein [Clostridia bacterium]
ITETLIGKYQDPSIYPLDNFSGRESGNGVGIIGTASGRNERMKNYPVALGNALNNINAARNNAQTMLQTNGSSIASIFIKIATADSSNLAATTFTKAEVETLGSMITGLETSNGYVWLAIKDIALASTLSRANDVELTDAQVTQLVADVEAATTPAELAAVTNMRAFTDEINDAIDNYEATATKISSARAAYNAFDVENNDGPFGYAAVKSLIDHLIDKTRVQVADKVNPGRDDKQDLIDAATGGQAVPITLLSGSGALYDIAKSAGDYRATGIETDVDNSGLTVHVRVSISTQAVAPILLTAARDQAVADLAPTNASGSTGSLDNAYGYAIDFGFRTNAPDAKLLLQDQARQRIYNDGTVTNTQTLGGGTYVKFSSLDLDKFTLDDIRALASALRIVFAIPELGEDSETGNITLSYKILTIAAPDITVTVNETTGEKTYAGGTPSDEDGDGKEETLTVNIALFGFTVADASDGGKIVTLGTKKLDAEDNTKNDLTLLTLTQNVAQKLSTVIYFDGDAIDNTMVANAEKSMTGSLNFQFATDVDLVPMENASLRNGENAPSEAEQIAAAKTKLHTAIEYIEGCDTYDTISAKAEGDRTEDEAAFLTSLNNANTVYANGDATLDEVNSAGTDLASKFNAVATSDEKAELLQLMQ